jgi:hypothetical protein
VAIKIPSSPSILDAILDANCSFGGHHSSGGRKIPVSTTTTAQVDSVCERHIVSGLLQRERHIVSGCCERHIVSGYIAIKIGASSITFLYRRFSTDGSDGQLYQMAKTSWHRYTTNFRSPLFNLRPPPLAAAVTPTPTSDMSSLPMTI